MATNYNDQFTGSGSPPSPVDPVTGAGETVAYKAPCRLATTGDVVLSGLQTIDGVMTAAGDRVLVLAQTDATRNGIYIAAAGAWQRARDFDSNRDITKGTRVAVTDGASQAGREYQITSANPINLGTSDITFVETLSSAGGAIESVNGKTGAVVLGAADILTDDLETVEDVLDAHDGRLTDAEAEQSAQAGRIDDLELEVTNHGGRITDLEAALGVPAYGAIGSYVIGFIRNTGIVENTTYAGSAIEPGGFQATATGGISDDGAAAVEYTKGGSALSGTWRAHSRANEGGDTRDRLGFFERIA